MLLWMLVKGCILTLYLWEHDLVWPFLDHHVAILIVFLVDRSFHNRHLVTFLRWFKLLVLHRRLLLLQLIIDDIFSVTVVPILFKCLLGCITITDLCIFYDFGFIWAATCKNLNFCFLFLTTSLIMDRIGQATGDSVRWCQCSGRCHHVNYSSFRRLASFCRLLINYECRRLFHNLGNVCEIMIILGYLNICLILMICDNSSSLWACNQIWLAFRLDLCFLFWAKDHTRLTCLAVSMIIWVITLDWHW